MYQNEENAGNQVVCKFCPAGKEFVGISRLCKTCESNFYQDEKWRANLYELAKIYFNENHVFKIYGGDLCTYDDYKRFYS